MQIYKKNSSSEYFSDTIERAASDYSEIWQLTAGHPIKRQTAAEVADIGCICGDNP